MLLETKEVSWNEPGIEVNIANTCKILVEESPQDKISLNNRTTVRLLTMEEFNNIVIERPVAPRYSTILNSWLAFDLKSTKEQRYRQTRHPQRGDVEILIIFVKGHSEDVTHPEHRNKKVIGRHNHLFPTCVRIDNVFRSAGYRDQYVILKVIKMRTPRGRLWSVGFSRPRGVSVAMSIIHLSNGEHIFMPLKQSSSVARLNRYNYSTFSHSRQLKYEQYVEIVIHIFRRSYVKQRRTLKLTFGKEGEKIEEKTPSPGYPQLNSDPAATSVAY
uniref:Uncharacterized protein n=1 Tax=Timema cristinae TaxID=61476 RepID=A0A7R9CXI3_TIMCR|nr:unnamed protein product [Timema cristinae]